MTRVALGLSVLLATACNPGVIVLDAGNDGGHAGGDETTSGDTSGNSGVGNSSSDGTTTEADDGSTFGDDDSDDGAAFISGSDLGPVCSPAPGAGYRAHCPGCDVLHQDCPRGDKCVPFANDGGIHWNATRCAPVEEFPAEIGEPCLMEGNPYSGLDNCAFGSICWGVDAETLEGTCVPMCTGSASDPQCPGDQLCSIANEGTVAVCLAGCDPLASACPAGESCTYYGDEFVCSPPIVETVGDGEPCELPHQCEAGHVCAAGEVVGCDAYACCTSLCDLGVPEPDTACSAGQMCAPFYDGQAPDGLETVGVCVFPE